MSRMLERLRAAGKLEEIQVRLLGSGFDEHGAPEYEDPVEVQARVIRRSAEVLTSEGDQVRTDLKLLVPEGEVVFPRLGSRVTYEGVDHVVEEGGEVKDVRGHVVHFRALCRKE